MILAQGYWKQWYSLSTQRLSGFVPRPLHAVMEGKCKHLYFRCVESSQGSSGGLPVEEMKKNNAHVEA